MCAVILLDARHNRRRVLRCRGGGGGGGGGGAGGGVKEVGDRVHVVVGLDFVARALRSGKRRVSSSKAE